jgi:von Willebrand factor type A domain
MTVIRRFLVGALGCLLLVSTPATVPASATAAAAPLRVVLLVDSSSAVATMLTQFRAGLVAFLDGLPDDVEVVFITTGGQLRIRVPATTDRERLRKAAAGFASDGGANSFLDTMLESDQRFLKPAADRRPVFVVVTTDSEPRAEPRIDDYNAFMNDFQRRGGRAHAVVIRGTTMGLASRILENLTQNTGGVLEVMVIPNGLSEKMKQLAAQVAAQQ